ncbi:SgcJ/EcaC family oxidoreductase [Kineosporia sp. NBRC 101731]|uniref:SgcJ/EcaC family oxidoreductase n=1 Tax=Kineosporia sp. NBRC 101731 TaxID=3032199 RepID=UPI0024A252F7|nr:SgcJ/EcaC family oxidoreductase [Kineosporia sp. NBRC 101731]GLY28636.1 hypothetical protein Kisp02_20010 [Kineosporia sp. NBRC 101731]
MTHREDLDAITRVVATVEHAQQNELPDEFVGLFRDDAIWTTGHGRRLFGRDEIADLTRRFLPGSMTETTQTYTVEHILFIRPDVAAVKVRQQYVTLHGEPLENEPLGSPLYVMSRENGEWCIVAGQNTLVVKG